MDQKVQLLIWRRKVSISGMLRKTYFSLKNWRWAVVIITLVLVYIFIVQNSFGIVAALAQKPGRKEMEQWSLTVNETVLVLVTYSGFHEQSKSILLG